MSHFKFAFPAAAVAQRTRRSGASLALAALLAVAPAGFARAGMTIAFTTPPTDIANVAGVVPLGNVSPASGHVLPSDHMYLRYADQSMDGSTVYPVRAMAAGTIVFAIKAYDRGAPVDYELYIKHDKHVTSYFIHIHALSERIKNHLDSTGAGWVPVGGPEMQMMILGQLGSPVPLPVEAGEEVGTTANYSESWDVGVVDDRVKGDFEGRGPLRYPGFSDYLSLLGYDLPSPIPGQKTLNAVSFIGYLSPEHGAAWFDKLVSVPKSNGRTGWDVQGRLRGAWFNPAVDTAAPPPLFDLESAVVSIAPYNLAPETMTQIGIASGSPLAALDPEGVYPQLRGKFVVVTDRTRGARVNPDPAAVGPKTGTVCYDLCYSDGGPVCNTLQLNMTGRRRVAMKYDPTPVDEPACAGKSGEEPDWTWVVYRR